MSMATRQYVDKSGWQRGVWDDEPDKAQWVDPATDLDCLIVRGPSDALCGYVGVAEGHPLFQVDYNNTENIDCHGGLTYSDFCQDGTGEGGICHVPEPGRPERVWWFGFDCAHSCDVAPAYEMHRGRSCGYFGESYRRFEFVKTEVEQLAGQLKAKTT